MKWIDYDKRLRKLYNTIVEAHSETTAAWRSEKADQETSQLMEELTLLLKDKEVEEDVD